MRKAVWIKNLAILLVVSMVMADVSVPVYAATEPVPVETAETELQETVPAVVEPEVSANDVLPEVVEEVDAEEEYYGPEIADLELGVSVSLADHESGWYKFVPEETGYYSTSVVSGHLYYWKEGSYDVSETEVKVAEANYNQNGPCRDNYTVQYFTAGQEYYGCFNSLGDATATVIVEKVPDFTELTYETDEQVVALRFVPDETAMYDIDKDYGRVSVYAQDGTQINAYGNIGGISEWKSYKLEKDADYIVLACDETGEEHTNVIYADKTPVLELGEPVMVSTDESVTLTFTPAKSGIYMVENHDLVGSVSVVNENGYVYSFYSKWYSNDIDQTRLYFFEAGTSYNIAMQGNSEEASVTLSEPDFGTFKPGTKVSVDDNFWIGKISIEEAGIYSFTQTDEYVQVLIYDKNGKLYEEMRLDSYELKIMLDQQFINEEYYILINSDYAGETQMKKIATTDIQCDSKTPLKVSGNQYISCKIEEDGLYAIYVKGEGVSSVMSTYRKEACFAYFDEGCLCHELKAGDTFVVDIRVWNGPADVYVTKLEPVAYEQGETVQVDKPVLLDMSGMDCDYISVNKSGENTIYAWVKYACGIGCFNAKGVEWDRPVTLISRLYDGGCNEGQYLNTVVLFSNQADPTTMSFTEKAVDQRTLKVGDLLTEEEPGVYEYSIAVDTTGTYRIINEYNSDEDCDMTLYEVTTENDEEIREKLWSEGGAGNDALISTDKKYRMEEYYYLEEGKQYVLCFMAEYDHVVGLEQYMQRVMFDYDDYNAFVEAGGTVSFVPYDYDSDEDNNYAGRVEETANGIIYYLVDSKLTISYENFEDPYNTWLLKPLSDEDHKGSYHYYDGWAIAPGEATYQKIAAGVEQTYHDYTTDTEKWFYLHTTAFYKVTGEGIAKVNMQDQIGDEGILLAERVPNVVDVTDIVLDMPTVMKTGDTAKIGVTLETGTRYEATNQGVTFKSSDEAVVKVDAEGNLTALKVGTATITVKSADGKVTKKVTITVTKQTYTISYELNGGTNNTANPASYTGGKTVTLQAPTMKGYTFEGWYTDPDFAEETKVTTLTKGNYVLYAKWREHQYSITFNGNHASVVGEMESIAGIGYDDEVTISENGFERTGYSFKGWNTKADGSGTTYADGATVSKLNKNDGKTVTLYAIWKKDKYTISYELDGGTNNTANPATYTVTTKTFTLAAPTKKGYTFEGWYTDIACEEEADATIAKGSTGNVTLYAKWTEHQYSIVFNGNHASVTGEMSDMTEIGYDDPVTLTGNNFARDGYTFKNWNTKADGSGKTYTDGAEVSKLASKDGKVVNLYAIWKKDKYTITYELDGGTNNTANPTTYTVTTKTTTLAAPTKKGYTFGGWYFDSSFDEQCAITKITKGNTGDVTLYAKWTENQYNIAFNSNHAKATGEMETISGIGYDAPITLPANEFIRIGYSFKGWNTKADGSGKTYADGAEVIRLAKQDGKTITLYAIWKKDKYTITYELDGGTNNTLNPATYTVTTKTVTLAAPTKKGYTFGGWYMDVACEGLCVTEITKGSTGNRLLYAKWTENEYNIAFNSNHAKATGEMETISGIGYDDPITLSENGFARTGYTFKCWNTKADGTGKTYTDGAEVSKLAAKDGKTVTLYAIWQKEKYTISYVVEDGTNNAKNPATYTITTTTITLKKPKYTGDGFNPTFGGWYTSPDFEEDTKVTTIPKGSTGNMTLYAKWIFG